MDILPIQASAVPCECVFSLAKETMSAHRNRISPELMEALQMLKFSVLKGRGLRFTEDWDKESEIKELEKLATDEDKVPEDMLAFIASLDQFGQNRPKLTKFCPDITGGSSIRVPNRLPLRPADLVSMSFVGSTF